MDPIENENPLADDANPPQAPLPDEQPPTDPPTDPPEESLEDAIDRALADDTPVDTDDEGDDPAPNEKQDGEDGGDGEPEGKKPDEKKADDKAKPKDDKAKKPEANAEDEAFISEHKMGDRAAERFRAMSQEIRETRPLVEALKAEQLRPDDLPKVIHMAKDMHQMNGIMEEAQCQPQQFGRALDTIALINSGKPENVNKAIDNLLEEVKLLAGAVGREVPGLVDPLEADPELADAVDRGDITRSLALKQLAQSQASKIQQSKQQQVDNTAQQQQAFEQGKQALNELGDQLHKADPAQYAAKEPYLIALAKRIRQTAQPDQWAQLIREAYEELPYNPAPPPPEPRRSGSAVSATRSGPGMVRSQPESMLDAIDQALESMNPR